ncbi:MAG: M48 family metalloprotease [Pseudomonadota bacterium]
MTISTVTTSSKTSMRGRRPLRLAAALGALCLLGALAGCAQTVNPATGARQMTSISPAEEQRLGDSQHPKILARYGGAYRDAKVSGYIAQIGGRLAANSELPRQKWTFTVLDTPTVNAFAVPGGYVYITRGMLAIANDEAEVAAVLGHEIGHVTARHTAQRLTQAQTVNVVGLLATIGAAAAGVDTGAVGQVAGLAGRGALASFSREQELEADQLGIRYISRAGYDGRGQADVLRALDRERQLRAKRSGGSASSVGFFSTHPATPQRVRAAEAIAARTPGAPAADARRRDAFLNAINGMAYGGGDKEGYVRGRDFVHPQLRFRFRAPPGYTLTNSSAAVTAAADGGRRVIFSGAPANGRGPLAYIRDDWARSLSRQARTGPLRALESITINGLPAATARMAVAGRSGTFDARLVAIRDGDRFYRFLALAPARAADREQARFQAMARSFRKLTAAEARRGGGRRIRVVRVRSGDTPERLARRMTVDSLPLETFRALNGLAPGQPLRAGQRVKLVVGG